MVAKVIDNDLGYAKWLEQMKDLSKQSHVNIGVLGTSQNQAKDEESGATLVEIASHNEFGTKTAPERSYIRSTIDERKRRIFGKSFQLQDDIFKGRMSVKKALGIMGALIKGNILQKVVDLSSPANAKATIDAKGSSNPLIDTGRLRQSIDYEIDL